MSTQSRDPGPGPGGYYDVARLAARLGSERSTIRSARRRGASWLPVPDGDLNGAPVWHVTRLVNVEQDRRPAGRPRKPEASEDA